jgi:hypothetical protein
VSQWRAFSKISLPLHISPRNINSIQFRRYLLLQNYAHSGHRTAKRTRFPYTLLKHPLYCKLFSNPSYTPRETYLRLMPHANDSYIHLPVQKTRVITAFWAPCTVTHVSHTYRTHILLLIKDIYHDNFQGEKLTHSQIYSQFTSSFGGKTWGRKDRQTEKSSRIFYVPILRRTHKRYAPGTLLWVTTNHPTNVASVTNSSLIKVLTVSEPYETKCVSKA